jgi:tRNA-uridine 2-sulfurtransferase
MRKNKKSFFVENKKEGKQNVIVAMSGGVDSSVAAALLKKEGFNVSGVFMRLWAFSENKRKNGQRNYSSSEPEVRARKVARILDIPFYVFDFEKDFKKIIVDRFLEESKKGLTPNPCVVCNKEIKFNLFLEKALKMGADFIATGHYARKSRNRKNRNWKLLKAKDKEKDQSYFLWQISQEELGRTLFPIGSYKKKEVEKLAKKFKLSFEKVKQSQGICFASKNVEDFLERYLKLNPGQIIDSRKKVLGQHQGLWFYTLGQRKGIGLSGGPYFVSGKKINKNLLIVDKDEKKLYQKKAIVEKVNWLSAQPLLSESIKLKTKIRYQHNSVSSTLKPLKKKRIAIIFDRPQRAVTSGQSAVFYEKDQLLGGGIIE